MIAMMDPILKELAKMRKQTTHFIQPASPHTTGHTLNHSFAAITARPSPNPHAISRRHPPPPNVLTSLEPKLGITHTKPLNTTLKDIPSGARVHQVKMALANLKAKVNNKILMIRGASCLSSGDLSLYRHRRHGA